MCSRAWATGLASRLRTLVGRFSLARSAGAAGAAGSAAARWCVGAPLRRPALQSEYGTLSQTESIRTVQAKEKGTGVRSLKTGRRLCFAFRRAQCSLFARTRNYIYIAPSPTLVLLPAVAVELRESYGPLALPPGLGRAGEARSVPYRIARASLLFYLTKNEPLT